MFGVEPSNAFFNCNITTSNLQIFLFLDHFIFNLDSASIQSFNNSWKKPLLISSKCCAVCSNSQILIWNLNALICQDLINTTTWNSTAPDNCFRTHIILANKLRIERVKIKAHNPIIHIRLYFFNISSGIVCFAMVLCRWNSNLLTCKVTKDNTIPDAHCPKCVGIVHATKISQGVHQINKTKLILKANNKFYIFNIVINVSLMIGFIQSSQVTYVTVIEFILTKHHFSDMI